MADEQASAERQLLLQKLYIKDCSFESPKAPEIFLSSVNTQTLLNIRSDNRQLDADHVEVTLTVNIKSVVGEETVFLIELVQAGVFVLTGFAPDERLVALGNTCPATLYPFAREAVANVANKGGFPQLLLQPLDFASMFAQNMRERGAQAEREAPAPDGIVSEPQPPQ
jgi:preprotein translocase subunit SecB